MDVIVDLTLTSEEINMTDNEYPKFRWFVLVAYVIITSATSFSMISPSPLIPFIAKGMGVNGGVIGNATMTSFNLFMGLFAFIGGFFLDKIGVFRMWIICLVLVGLGSILVPIIGTTVAGLIFCRVLHAAGTGPIMASIAALSSQQFKFNERTYIAAFQGFSVCFGIGVGQYFVPVLYKMVGENWMTALAWTSVFPAIAMIFAFIVLLGPTLPVVHAHAGESGNTQGTGDYKKALIYSTVYVLALMGLIDSWCQQVFNGMMPGFYNAAIADGGLNLTAAGVLGSSKLSLAAFFMAAGTLVAPFVNDKIFKGNPKPTIFIGLAIAAAFILVIQKMTPTTGDLILVGVPCGILFFSSFVNPTIFGYVAKHYPGEIAGRLGGFIMFFFVIGSAVGLFISNTMYSSTGSYMSPFLLLAIVTLCGGIAVMFLKPPKGFEWVYMHGQKK
jgi:MFS family permease